MKIVFFTDKISYSGASKIICWLANKITNDNSDVTLITHIDTEDQKNIDKKIKRIKLKNKDKNKIIHGIKTIINLHKIIKKEKPDICIGFLPTECLYLLIASRFCKTKVIVCERSDPYFEKSFIANLGRFFFRYADGAVFQTNGAKEFFSKKIQDKSIIIPNPAFINKKQIQKIEKKYELSTSGRLFIKQKRQDILLRAFKLVADKDKNIKLKIYGDGPDLKYLKELSKELNIEKKVFFEGKVNNIEEKISASKIFILTSDYEGIPNSIIEAFQVGLPVISTDCSPGGASFLIKNDINGYIVPIQDYQELSKKILKLLNNDILLNKMSKNNLIKIQEFDENKIYIMWKKYIKRIYKGDIV